MRQSFLIVAILFGSVLPRSIQEAEIGPRLVRDPTVRAALDSVKQSEVELLEDQIRLCEIPAPPFKEAQRAEAYKRRFEELGLRNVRIDKAGNVLGERAGRAARPHLVFSAHLDTVFPEGTVVRTTRDGALIKGPGIGDDCRGLAVVIGIIGALNRHHIQTDGSITFVGTVGEEGLGDLRGVKHLFNESLKGKIDRFISVDGTGLGITNVGVGSYRYRVTFKGPGGHSFGAFGLANPIHALGRAIAHISEFQVSEQPRTTFNVGRIGGGTSVNSIPFEAWMEMDMRSADATSLRSIDERFHQAVDRSLREENERWGNQGRLAVAKDLVGHRPPGSTPENSPIVRAAVSVQRALGFPVALREGSTDSNVPMALGIPLSRSAEAEQGRGHIPPASRSTRPIPGREPSARCFSQSRWQARSARFRAPGPMSLAQAFDPSTGSIPSRRPAGTRPPGPLQVEGRERPSVLAAVERPHACGERA
jgi:tripeptide aminopeptidase